MVIYSLSMKYRTNTYEPIIVLFWILFFASGMFITERYYDNGLLAVRVIKKIENYIFEYYSLHGWVLLI
jgi:hypothetical protein